MLNIIKYCAHQRIRQSVRFRRDIRLTANDKDTNTQTYIHTKHKNGKDDTINYENNKKRKKKRSNDTDNKKNINS